MAHDLLVIVPCGQAKVWDKDADAGATQAKDAYTGSPFVINRKFAECFGDAWVILSAKYGFIEPTFEVPEAYNVTFKHKGTGPVSVDQLRKQVRAKRLGRFKQVIGLGGKEYRKAIEAAFQGTSPKLHFPFRGLPIGKTMQAAKHAVDNKKLPIKSIRIKPMNVPRSSNSCNIAEMCHTLHRWFNARPMFRFPFREQDIPLNGIYILFEEGEHAHGTQRIVRVGTHTGDNQLRSRLKQHFLNEFMSGLWQIEWWGQFGDLIDGSGDFPARIRSDFMEDDDGFGGPATAIPGDKVDAFRKYLEEYGY